MRLLVSRSKSSRRKLHAIPYRSFPSYPFCCLLAVAAWPEPLDCQLAENSHRSAAENQSVAGKISSVGDASFTVDVRKNQEKHAVEFQVDGNAKVEGKLAVGAEAGIEYHVAADRNIAVHVVVTPTSGIRLY